MTDNMTPKTLDDLERETLLAGGDAPCSRYGVKPRDWVPVVRASAEIYIDNGYDVEESWNAACELVVNDSHYPAWDLKEVEHELFDPEWLKGEEDD